MPFQNKVGPSHGGTVRKPEEKTSIFNLLQVFNKLARKIGAVRCLLYSKGSMENTSSSSSSSSSHGPGVVALAGSSVPGPPSFGAVLNAGNTCDQPYTSATAAVVADASLPQAPARQYSAMCKLDGCSDLAVFVFEGDAVGAYCQAHKPIGPVEARTQPCFFKGCTRGVSHGREHVRASSCVTHKQPGMMQMRGVPCEFPGCQANPSYALQGETQGRCCKKHVSPGMLFVDSLGCSVPNCQRSAIWVEATDNRQRACREHRRAGVAYAQIVAICAAKDCFQEPCYGMVSSGKPVFCQDHKTDGMTEVRPQTCATPGCCKIPGYGLDGKRQVCRDHKTAGMTGAVLTCESPLCNKNPSFAPRGEKRRRFCKRHAEPGMVNAYYKYCDVNQCPERASFGAGGKLRCLEHCEAGMKPRSNICRVEGGGCTRQSSYGPEGGKPVVCTQHKLLGMVQVRTKTCKQQGCDKIPSYGFSCKSREYCKPHALPGMVYSAGNRCRARKCRASGIFNHLGVRGGSFCQDHKEDGMVDVRPKKCEVAGCKYAASYGDKVERTRRFCARHKLDGMFSYQDLWPRPGKVAKTPVTVEAAPSFNSAASGVQTISAGVVTSAGATQLSAVTGPPDTYAASEGASANPLAYGAGALVADVGTPIAEIGRAVASGTVTASPLGAEGTREAAEIYSPLATAPGPTPGAPPPPAGIATAAAAAATVGTVEGVTSAAVAVSTAAPAATSAAAMSAAGIILAGFVRPGASRKAQSARRAKRPRKDSPPGTLAPAPNTSRFRTAFPPIPPYAQILSPGGNGGAMFPPGLSFPGLMGQWNWLAAGVANASMAAAAGINGGGGTTPSSLPLPSPSPGLSVQAVGSLPAAGPAMGLPSLKDAAAAAASASTPGTLGFFPVHSPSPAIATTSRASEGAVAQPQTDRASGGGSVSSTTVDNGTGTPVPSFSLPLPADVPSSSSKEIAAPAPGKESSPAFWNLEQEAPTRDSTKRSAGEMQEEETFLATLVNSMDASNLKTVAVRRAMMSRLKNVGRAVAD